MLEAALRGALVPLTAYAQFILYRVADKMPIDPRTCAPFARGADWQNDPAATVSAADALERAAAAGPAYGVGFLFTERDPFFFVDIDKCLNPDGATWSDLALRIVAMLPGAAVEVSQSGRGLHIFGTGTPPAHANKNTALGLELYTKARYVALTGTGAIGSAAVDCSAALPALVSTYYPARAGGAPGEGWTVAPCAGWAGPDDDDALLAKACAVTSAAAAFGNRCTFAQLFAGDADAIGRAYPGDALRPFDASSADAALAQHLAFWTGKNCDRIFRLMWRSGLIRDKWGREDYLINTILNAVSIQVNVYSAGGPADNTAADALGAPKLRASSDAQRAAGERIRAVKLSGAPVDVARVLCASSGPQVAAKFWLDNQALDVVALAAMVTPTTAAVGNVTAPVVLSGFQFLGLTMQLEHFAGCVYVTDFHAVLTPGGQFLKSEQFNSVYGGYVFQVDETGDKTTNKAWEAFTESRIIRWPKVDSTCFRPELMPGTIVKEDGRALVNSYVPIETPRADGDAGPFIRHLAKVLPVESDRAILLAYMAAVVQYKGVKFQWAPLLQGAEGNGKTLFTRCVGFAVGARYTHMPPANEISEKFNEWLFNKIFIGIEDVYVPENKREVIEVLKPMITNDRLAMRAMQKSQIMGDNRANFMLNSNHKDAIRKTGTDRRFAVMYTAQQGPDDLQRDGMTGNYFPDLYDWLRAGGYAIVAQYLERYAIPDELNPATKCHRAPLTSSTVEAIAAGTGSVEQEILEAIDEGRPGFAGGWISSIALDKLLHTLHATRTIPVNKRRELLNGIGYEWHGALVNGRTNNPVPMDDGKKPRLFIRNGHIHDGRNVTTAADVVRLYTEAQSVAAAGPAARVFGAGSV